MWETCVDRIRDMGNTVHLKHYVTGIEQKDGRVTAVRARTPDGERRFECEHVISTTAIRSLVRALDPAVPVPVREAGDGLAYRDFLVVALMLEAKDLFPDNWIYIHTPGVKVGRIQNFNNWSQAMVPVEGHTCLGLEYFCFKGDGLWESKDEDLVKLATEEFLSLELTPRDIKVVDGAVIRMPKAYPIYDSKYRAHLDAIRDYIDPISNLHTVGRNGMHKYNNQDHSMLTAMMAVDSIVAGKTDKSDLWTVNTDTDYHEEKP
jgi:protoporphyrinogen oxidase